MQARMRFKLAMATRARDYAQAHPDTTPRATESVVGLGGLLTMATALAKQSESGRAAARQSTAATRCVVG